LIYYLLPSQIVLNDRKNFVTLLSLFKRSYRMVPIEVSLCCTFTSVRSDEIEVCDVTRRGKL